MIVNLLLTVVYYFILMYVSVNLLGLLVRGLFTNPDLENMKNDEKIHEFIKKEVEKSQNAEKWVNITALVLSIVFFFILFHFWNIGVVLAALIIMAGRLPDLLWEIKHGKRTNPNLMKKNALYYISAFLPWLALPVLYYSLYIFN